VYICVVIAYTIIVAVLDQNIVAANIRKPIPVAHPNLYTIKTLFTLIKMNGILIRKTGAFAHLPYPKFNLIGWSTVVVEGQNKLGGGETDGAIRLIE
jgi:hypothetical protein